MESYISSSRHHSFFEWTPIPLWVEAIFYSREFSFPMSKNIFSLINANFCEWKPISLWMELSFLLSGRHFPFELKLIILWVEVSFSPAETNFLLSGIWFSLRVFYIVSTKSDWIICYCHFKIMICIWLEAFAMYTSWSLKGFESKKPQENRVYYKAFLLDFTATSRSFPKFKMSLGFLILFVTFFNFDCFSLLRIIFLYWGFGWFLTCFLS